jgi:N-acetylmuramoyl-L-alanine amidase
MLIECAFIDSDEDMQRYNAENIANAIVNGIINQ